ncbi:MAG: tRNA epoxyqueuosine(34) reductase QueG [Thermoplasmata archaeon]
MLLDQEISIPSDLKYSSIRVKMNNNSIFKTWLSLGFHGSMSYLSSDDGIKKRVDPSLLMRESKSIVVFLLNYKSEVHTKEGYGRIAKYACFEDYHRFFPKIIDKFMIENGLFRNEYRTYVDTGPISERNLATNSMNGWIGRNSMFIHPALGSFTFLGVSITDIALDSPSMPSTDLCGSCTRCIESCPTGAINLNRTINSNLCISYQTIENRGVIPSYISNRMKDMIFGCDICNDVCPWNGGNKKSSIPEVNHNQFSNKLKLEDIAFMDKRTFDDNYRKSAIRRAAHEGLARNAIIALYNANREDLVREASKQFSDVRGKQAAKLLESEIERK